MYGAEGSLKYKREWILKVTTADEEAVKDGRTT